MLRLLAVAVFLFSLTGCSAWQANSSSQAVDFDPFAPSLTPANGNGYVDGEGLDMRTRH